MALPPMTMRTTSGPRPGLRAITFDFWDTLMWEHPGSLRTERLQYWAEEGLSDRIGADKLESAHDEAHSAYVEAWKHGRQFRIEAAAELIAERGGLTQDSRARRTLLEGFREAGRRAQIEPAPGVRECLEQLRNAGLVIGIVCDIGLTPSGVVRELLEREDLLGCFDATTFSDEVGHFKPSPEIFRYALAELGGVEPRAAAHIGDRRRTDVAGALNIGMLAIRFVGPRDHETEETPEGDLVVERLDELPAALLACVAR